MPAAFNAFNAVDRIVHRCRQQKITVREAIYRLGRMSPGGQDSAQVIRERLNINHAEWSLDKVLDAMAQPPAVNSRLRES